MASGTDTAGSLSSQPLSRHSWPLARELLQWQGWPFDPQEEYALRDAYQRNRALMRDLATKKALLSSLPADPGGLWHQRGKLSPLTFLENLRQRHGGELKEISNGWNYNTGLPPTFADAPHLYSEQFALTDALFHNPHRRPTPAISGTSSSVGGVSTSTSAMVASGTSNGASGCEEFVDRLVNKCYRLSDDCENSTHYFTRHARVFGLVDLWSKFGDEFSAKTLYEAYCHWPTLVAKRKRSSTTSK